MQAVDTRPNRGFQHFNCRISWVGPLVLNHTVGTLQPALEGKVAAAVTIGTERDEVRVRCVK